MAHTITPAEVRFRLTDLTTVDIPDATLNSASFIPASDAWADIILANNGTDAATIDANQTALLKAAKIDWVCIRVVTKMPREDFRDGFIQTKRVSPTELKDMVKMLKDNISELIDLCGWAIEDSWGFTYAGGADYTPETYDDTNIDFGATTSERPFNIFGEEV